MNTKILLAFSLAGCISAQAGIDDGHLNRLSPKVREFVEKYKVQKANKENINKQSKKIVLKNDILGRKVNRGHIQDSTVYIVKEEIEPKMEVTVTDLTVENANIEPLGTVQYSYNNETNEENFWINGKKIDKKTFQEKQEDWEKRRAKKFKPLKNSYKAFLTPTEIENKLKSSENIYIEDGEYVAVPNFIEATTAIPGFGNNYTVYLASHNEAFSLSQLNNAHANGYKGNNIGIYFMDESCANAAKIPNPSKYKAKGCNNGTGPHSTAITDLLQTFAPSSTIYGYDYAYLSTNVDLNDIATLAGPKYPHSVSPQIYVGTVSIGLRRTDGVFNNEYAISDAAFDNYIYNTGVTEFINAGNYDDTSVQPEPTIQSPGKAVNAITVGAVDPKKRYNQSGTYGYNYLPYSCHINSELGNTKPDIMNITGFYDNIYPEEYNHIFGGTSASTPFSAAMAADLMSKKPIFRGHPEIVKSLFLTTTSGTNIYNRDNDGGAVNGIPSFNKMISSKNFAGYISRATEDVLFRDANGNRKTYYDIFIDGVDANENYKLAFSWLMKGSRIINSKKLPLRFAIFVYQNGALISATTSATPNDQPYTLQTLKTLSSDRITIRVILMNNDAPDDEIVMGYHMSKV